MFQLSPARRRRCWSWRVARSSGWTNSRNGFAASSSGVYRAISPTFRFTKHIRSSWITKIASFARSTSVRYRSSLSSAFRWLSTRASLLARKLFLESSQMLVRRVKLLVLPDKVQFYILPPCDIIADDKDVGLPVRAVHCPDIFLHPDDTPVLSDLPELPAEYLTGRLQAASSAAQPRQDGPPGKRR